MVEYYFDLETYSPEEKPDPTRDKIITIQYQKLSRDGKPLEPLQILTEWELGSEKALLDAFRNVFLTENPFDFIPIGINLHGFDLLALISGFKRHFEPNFGLDLLRTKPVLDLKPTLVLACDGSFSGWGGIFGKPNPNPVKSWYDEGSSGRLQIKDYVTREAQKFIRVYQYLKWATLPFKAELLKVVA
jgi:hypothetical protein